jgi:hypothetical protein
MVRNMINLRKKEKVKKPYLVDLTGVITPLGNIPRRSVSFAYSPAQAVTQYLRRIYGEDTGIIKASEISENYKLGELADEIPRSVREDGKRLTNSEKNFALEQGVIDLLTFRGLKNEYAIRVANEIVKLD